MTAKLYVIRGSHACRAGMLMLEHKGIEYETVILMTGPHATAVRLRGFPGRTVPALRYDGERVQTNSEISRFLDRVRPEPPLFPADPAERKQVEEAERWGNDELQMIARRLGFAGMLFTPGGVAAAGDGRLGPMLARGNAQRKMIARTAGRFIFDVTPETERELLDALPEKLDRIDAWIEGGVLNADELNAADFAISPCLALLCYRPDLRPDIEARPAGRLMDRVLPTSPRSPAPL